MVTTVNDIAKLKVAKKVNLKRAHHKEKNVITSYGDRW